MISSESENDNYDSKNTQNENSESISTFPMQDNPNEDVGKIMNDVFPIPKSKNEENLNEKVILTNIDQNKEKESSEIQEKNF